MTKFYRTIFTTILSVATQSGYATTDPCLSTFLSQDFNSKNFQIKWDKPQPFKKVDKKKQKKFESNFTLQVSIDSKPLKNQCHSGCGIASLTTYLEHLAAHSGVDIELSQAYLGAKSYEVKFLNTLNDTENSVRLSTVNEGHIALKTYGISPERSYPSDHNVNTEELARVLNLIKDRYHLLASRVNKEDLSLIKLETYELGSRIVQEFFGSYPEKLQFVVDWPSR